MATNSVTGMGNRQFAVDVALLVIRLCVGFAMFYHGAQKLFGWFGGDGMQGFIGFVTSFKLPVLSGTVWAYMAAATETFGGLALMVGLLARLSAIPTIFTMIIAIIFVHGPNGYSILTKGYEYNVAIIGMAAAILIAGPGLISADAFIFRKGLWARGAQPLDNPANRV